MKPEAEPELEVKPSDGAGVDVLQRILTNRHPGAPAPPHPPAAAGDDADGWLSDVSESKDDDGSIFRDGEHARLGRYLRRGRRGDTEGGRVKYS